jgi:hypothetical protein
VTLSDSHNLYKFLIIFTVTLHQVSQPSIIVILQREFIPNFSYYIAGGIFIAGILSLAPMTLANASSI